MLSVPRVINTMTHGPLCDDIGTITHFTSFDYTFDINKYFRCRLSIYKYLIKDTFFHLHLNLDFHHVNENQLPSYWVHICC